MLLLHCFSISFFFFFNDTATTEIYTLSLHDALPISRRSRSRRPTDSERRCRPRRSRRRTCRRASSPPDRKSTRLNSSHSQISYAVFCLKKKKKTKNIISTTTKNIEHPQIINPSTAHI